MSKVECPECGKSLKVPDSKRGATVRCPACQAKFRIPELKEPRRPNHPRERDSRRSRSRQERPGPGSRSSRLTPSDSFDTKAFIKRLLPVHGAVLGLSTLLIIGGFFSAYSSLAAAGLLIVAAIGCIITGRVWMAIDIGRRSVGIGIAALLVPAVGVVYAFRKKGPPMRGAITLISCLAPTLLLGLVVLLFAPGENGRPAFGPRSPSTAQSPETWARMIEQAELNLTDDSPIITANLKITLRPGGSIDDLAARGDSLLQRFPSYVPGSFSVDIASRTGTLQYRGQENRKSAYAYFVGLSTNTFVRAE